MMLSCPNFSLCISCNLSIKNGLPKTSSEKLPANYRNRDTDITMKFFLTINEVGRNQVEPASPPPQICPSRLEHRG